MQKSWIKWILALVVQLGIWQVLFRIPSFVEFWTVHVISMYQNIIHQFTAYFSTGFGELFYVVLFLFIGYIIYQSIKKRSCLLVLKLVFGIVFIYNSLWGIVYFRENFELDKEFKIEDSKLKVLYKKALNEATDSRKAISLNENQPIQIKLTVSDYLKEFDQNQYLLLNEKWVLNQNIITNPTIIHSQFSTILSYSGVLGYYNPFLVESNINTSISDLKLGSTVFHELAHQKGFASESEANFVAYLIGDYSDIPEIRYFTNYKLMFYLLNLIALSDKNFATEQVDRIIPKGILEDRKAEILFYSKYDGSLNDSFSFMNNQFLKMNNQDGVISYSKYIELVYYYQFYIKKASY